MTTPLEQVSRQLNGLGYRQGDRVWVRLLVAKNIPIEEAKKRGLTYFSKKEKKDRNAAVDGYLTWGKNGHFLFTEVKPWGEQQQYGDGLRRLQLLNKRGYGVYLVVNPGGREDAEITEARTIFCESDSETKEQQWEKLQRLEFDLGRRASLVVETRKSLHIYFRLGQAIAPESFTRYQQRLVQRQDSDPCVVNPARLMRLASFDHAYWNGEDIEFTPVKLVQCSGEAFTLQEFDHLLPEWDRSRWEKKTSGGDRTPTNASDDPWDIRNFAPYLEGFNANGRRRGWMTCKCPAHNGESSDSLHIEVSTGAFKCHAQCDSKAIYQAALEQAKAAGHELPATRRRAGGEAPLPDYSLSFPADVTINERYIPRELEIPAGEKLICIRAPKGSGKTELLSALVGAVDQPALVPTYRQQLAMQLAFRLGIGYKSEHGTADRLRGLALCVDSLIPNSEARFNADGWKDALIIIDEAESVVWHLLNSSTCENDRMQILVQLQQVAKNALNPCTRGRLVLSDADLSDIPVNFFLSLAEAPDIDPYVIRNDCWKPEQGWKVHNYQKHTDLLFALEKAIAAGGKHIVQTTAQKPQSKWGTLAIESKLKAKFPGKKILRIDVDTVGDPNHPAFECIDVLNALLPQYDIIIASPTIETGVSIDLYGVFAGIWQFASGNTPESSIRQFLARVRDVAVPRHLSAAERGCNFAFIGKGETDPKALLETMSKEAQVNLRAIKDASFHVDIDGSVHSNGAALEAWGKMGARINRGLHRYREAILEGLKAEGHTIIEAETRLSKEESQRVSDEMGAVRDTNHHIEAAAVAAAAPPETEDDYKELKKKKAKTPAERRSQRHYELKQRYGGDVSPDLVLKDDDGWHSFLKLHYYLTVGAEFIKPHDRERFKAVADDQGRVFLPDLQRQLSAKVEALRVLGFTDLLQMAIAGEELHSEHPKVQEFHKRVGSTPGAKELTGVEVQSTAISTLQECFAQLLGFRLLKSGQKTITTTDGKKVRPHFYRYPTQEALDSLEAPPKYHPFDGREEVFAAWLERDREKAIKSDEGGELHTKNHIDLYKGLGVQCAGVQETCAGERGTGTAVLEREQCTPPAVAIGAALHDLIPEWEELSPEDRAELHEAWETADDPAARSLMLKDIRAIVAALRGVAA